MPSLLDNSDATGNSPRSGHERKAVEAQRSSEGSFDEPQPNQAARRRGRRLDDSGTQAQGRRQGRAEESQQDHAQGHPQDASDCARPILDGVAHSADQGVEPRSGQHAETDADISGKGTGRGARTHTRPTLRVGISGPGKSLQQMGNAVGARMAQGMATYWTRLGTAYATRCDSCRLDKTYKADIKRITLNIVSPEERLLVLEALSQTEAESTYGRCSAHSHGTRAADLSGRSPEYVKITVKGIPR